MMPRGMSPPPPPLASPLARHPFSVCVYALGSLLGVDKSMTAACLEGKLPRGQQQQQQQRQQHSRQLLCAAS
ncbi:hypothetical protein AWZ03_000508 [Drosophila navojoa]|uniref:Uncharacterized protein n=1 Tax=Drosophila navojoa TaxID=7232 RepID=A0A484BYY8_DRONA|nr:hypothetical protein AWZ03_000508 [Drosophila navojoa]